MPRRKTGKSVGRLCCVVNADVAEAIKSIQRQSKSISITEMVSRSIKLYAYYLKNQSEGGKMQAKKKNGEIERIIVI